MFARVCGGVLILGLPAITVSAADFNVNDVGALRGIEAYVAPAGFCAGVTAVDFDDDGDIDLFVPTDAGVPHQLYRNLGNGHFEEIGVAAGVGDLARGRAAVFADLNGDHRVDLIVAGDCYGLDEACLREPTLRLYMQVADAQFVETTETAGFGDDLVTTTGQHRGGLVAADLDDDGDLDLVLGLWAGEARILINDGTGSFSESAIVGLTGQVRGYWQPLAFDVDRDGDTDLFWAIDFSSNLLFLNQGDGTFIESAAPAGVDQAWNDMGIAFADPDNDGDLDIQITEITQDERFSVLFRNDSAKSSLQYTEVAQDAGIATTGFAWGTTFFDADLDGALDLAVTNGFFNPPHDTDPSFLYRNIDPAALLFEDVSTEVGFDDTDRASGLVSLDFDRDGDVDLVQVCSDGGPLRLLENQLTGDALQHHWLVVRPRMPGANHRAIGARVRVDVGARTSVAAILAGSSILSQEPAEAHFGMGLATTIDCVTVEFPDGSVVVRTDVAADQVLTITAGDCGADLDCNGTVGFADLLIILGNWGPCDECPADLDDSSDVGFADLLTLLAAWGPLCG